MDIYLDANATTPVLPAAREAALAVMAETFGNPSSIHGAGLKVRALMDEVRATGRRVLDAPTGRLLFTSGATEGIQTAVLSALMHLRQQRSSATSSAALSGDPALLHRIPHPAPHRVLYGATEHKAVPEALAHWNEVLGLGLEIMAIPVGLDGRHDLRWLRDHMDGTGLVCTMAANNETGVITDIDGVADALQGHNALWLVDGVQALGKLPLHLIRRRIDYAPFSGHKLYAPKGIGMLYVREGAPFTPLLAGGGQESASRSGTENTAGIAALGAVLKALESGNTFGKAAVLLGYRDQLVQALRDAFPGVIFNAPFDITLPTTLNVSVPGLSARTLLDLFDAAGIRASGGSACGAAKAQPSYVLQAMGLPQAQTASAVRLSFGPADAPAVIAEACRRLRACGEALTAACQPFAATRAAGGSSAMDGETAGQTATPTSAGADAPAAGDSERITRWVVDGACCYAVWDATSNQCVIIDPLPELTGPLLQWVTCREARVAAVLDTHGHGDHASSAPQLRDRLADRLLATGPLDALGWPEQSDGIALGSLQLKRLSVPGHTVDSTAYLLEDAQGLSAVFIGDTVMPGALGRSDFPVSAPLSYVDSLHLLHRLIGRDTLLLPGHDYDNRFATTLAIECAAQPLLEGVLTGRLQAPEFTTAKADLERHLPPTQYQTIACGARIAAGEGEACVNITQAEVAAALAKASNTSNDSNESPAMGAPRLPTPTRLVLVDVREAYEHQMGPLARRWPVAAQADVQVVPLSQLLNQLPSWQALPAETTLVFCCRSGNRSTQAARALRRLGHAQAYSLVGGLALLP
ncbi:aminotransferase class V-fold PLP-dependent enzyme [Roseateles terrae]|uniref:cysteine desulfurase n=1 Tax=Roseateles terrae TaxID=431060 RepID=A0ABR6GQZ3_9BURK|nr:aminotransferase class V-fold PLP-dependent enzyme [Roseateles terrae]MBB3194484.1 cysteine sulfinate desulfinase/cysteine desulfurase-like protein/glyoxylase-like metal-dependent hydrolase (beta-lactamase superfamily II)/rhodanese-related sulfurtransferase [Roseateles terrae]OWQ83502.1 cysteine desulfurase [Roseateles terrae]